MTDITDILDATLDDLADLPEWKPYPAGVHLVLLSTKQGSSAQKNPLVVVTLKLKEVIELKDPTEPVPAPGTECSVTYTLNQEIGQGKLKNLMAKLIEITGTNPRTPLRQLIKEFQNIECVVVTQIRENKDKTQKFTDIVEVVDPAAVA